MNNCEEKIITREGYRIKHVKYFIGAYVHHEFFVLNKNNATMGFKRLNPGDRKWKVGLDEFLDRVIKLDKGMSFLKDKNNE